MKKTTTTEYINREIELIVDGDSESISLIKREEDGVIHMIPLNMDDLFRIQEIIKQWETDISIESSRDGENASATK